MLKGQTDRVLFTIVKGELVEKAKQLGLGFVPPDVSDFKLLLEFYMEDGTGILNKARFGHLIESFFSQEVKHTEYGKLIRGSALLNSLATSSYSNKENHVAVVEAWMIYLSYLLWFCEKNNVGDKEWKNEFEIGNKIIRTSLENIWNEVKEKEHLTVGKYHGGRFFGRV
ncbi:MAG: hypothetical protein WDN75_19510 [Bacteroidota bacterium]